MFRTSLFLFFFVLPNILFSQQKFKLELTSKLVNNDEIIFSPNFIRVGFENLYKIQLETNVYVEDMSKIFKNKCLKIDF